VAVVNTLSIYQKYIFIFSHRNYLSCHRLVKKNGSYLSLSSVFQSTRCGPVMLRIRTDSYGITLTGLGAEKPEGSRPDFTEGWKIKINQVPRQSVNHPRNKNVCKSSITAVRPSLLARFPPVCPSAPPAPRASTDLAVAQRPEKRP
jgi:hypothetical protein